MNEHSLHMYGSHTTNTVARNRRVRAARRRMADVRARMAEGLTSSTPATEAPSVAS
jgi:hypothetical protein